MTDAIGIGYFQVDNLVKTRVPFCLLMIDGSFENLYQGQELEHLRRYSSVLQTPPSVVQALAILETRKHRKFDPILVVCSRGQISQAIANEIGTHGYLNCYFVVGGLERLQMSALEVK